MWQFYRVRELPSSEAVSMIPHHSISPHNTESDQRIWCTTKPQWYTVCISRSQRVELYNICVTFSYWLLYLMWDFTRLLVIGWNPVYTSWAVYTSWVMNTACVPQLRWEMDYGFCDEQTRLEFSGGWVYSTADSSAFQTRVRNNDNCCRCRVDYNFCEEQD